MNSTLRTTVKKRKTKTTNGGRISKVELRALEKMRCDVRIRRVGRWADVGTSQLNGTFVQKGRPEP